MAANARVQRIMGHLSGATVSSRTAVSNATAAKFFTKPARVVVTGAAGNIAYAILFMIGQGNLLGDQPIDLVLLDIPVAAKALEGVAMEIRDCAFPVINSITCTTDYAVGFKDAQVCLLIGAKPRGKGMQRADLLKGNAGIFAGQGKAIDQYADKNVKVLVVGNPANTNATICSINAPSIPNKNFTAMTRLDQNRALSQVASKTGAGVADMEGLAVWGNHSLTQYPCTKHATINGQPMDDVVQDDAWLKGKFLSTVQNRGGEIIQARGKSSAASAAKAAVDHMRDWILGTEGRVVSMGVISDGNTYGVPAGITYSFPCVCENGEWKIVEGLHIDSYSRGKIDASAAELQDEKRQALA